ncbi:MAB_1171c family putative transporter [Streptomyces viridochromogenes]|uniref:MAB_1171c family putative transporter n=1 Tax=Streptomyces viridochromogenes TaxID=1938 RepID=UPI0031D39EE9
MNLTSLHIPYTVPAVLLVIALGLKLPTFMRAWRDPDVRATTLLLLLAAAVFLSVAPVNIHRLNTATGIPNIAAAWTYSLLTAFCGSCLTMVITWREEPSPRRRRRIRRVWAIYTGIILGLWGTFALADVPSERIYDLDTYYASEPWMREHILLYLLAHMVSALVAAYMIWKWISKVRAGWLKAGMVFLQAGYAFGLVFDIAKLTAIGARWAGANWDNLSTEVAPPFAILDASLVGIGFILPVLGPFLQKWPREQATYWILRPLARTVRHVAPSSARARVGRLAPLDLRLVQRQTHIHDALLRLAPYIDYTLYRTAHSIASDRYSAAKARGLAGAVAISAAVQSYRQEIPRDTSQQPAQINPHITNHISDISRAMHRPRLVDSLRQRVTHTERATTHA